VDKVSVLQVRNGQVINRYDDITTTARSVDGQSISYIRVYEVGTTQKYSQRI